MAPTHSLVASELHKRYGDTRALDGFSLSVRPATIHGLLGPNGAGKSTAVRALTTLISIDSGTATIDGYDVTRSGNRVRERIGLVGQAVALDDILGGRQNLVMFARLFNLGRRQALARADELLEQFDLTDAADKPVSGYSGGMRRRLDIAASLILTPAVLFLDEPTTGLDPRGRGEVWDAVRQVRASGTTVLLTTQYLDEADQLADTISVMNHGKVIAEGTPGELKRQRGGDRVEVIVGEHELDRVAQALHEALGTPPGLDRDTRTVTAAANDGTRTLATVIRTLDAVGVDADDVVLRRPTLDEAFLALTDKETA
jgi:ABC-2 type transport system ATP-binding protein